MTTHFLPQPSEQSVAPPAGAAPFSSEAIANFWTDGYLVLPAFLDQATCDELSREVDVLVDGPAPSGRQIPLELPGHGRLITESRLMAHLETLMEGTRFQLHHIHSTRHDAGCPGVAWHHDYEQYPQSNRSHLMVHVFFYLNGLTGEIGDLMVLPRSHRSVMERDALSLCGTSDLPGTRVFDRLPPGSALIVHSALLHARRAKGGGEQRPRYFIDISYCQGGISWPAYPQHEQIFGKARRLGLGQAEGREDLFDPSPFFASDVARERLQRINQGSLVERLP